MNRSALLVIFSGFEGNKILQFKLNAGRTAGELLDWGRTRLGMSCGMAVPKLLVGDSKPSIPQFPHWNTEDGDPSEPWHLSSIPPVQCSAAGAVAVPGVGELPQILLVTTAVMSLVPVQDHHFGQRCTVIHPAAQLLLLPAEQSLVCTNCVYSPYQNRSLWPSMDASSLLRHSHHSDSTAIKKLSLHKNEESEMKMKKNQL